MTIEKNNKKAVDKKALIRKCAKNLFSSKGYKDTSVSDITNMAGIAAGTFYLYYASKEKLFMEIYLDENLKLKEKILKSIDQGGEPLKVIQELVQLNITGIRSNPILKEWYNRDVFQKIEQNYREENGIDQFTFLYDSFIEIFNRWQEKGKIRADITSEMIMAMFAAIINMDTHKEEIGFKYFPEVQQLLTGFVMSGLTDCSSRGNERLNAF